jgi:bacteriocin biosynthesis cyclodehydratase domain-containing protein
LRVVTGAEALIPARPHLSPWYRLVGDGDRLLLEHGQVVVALEGAAVSTLLPPLLPLLDGTRTLDDIAERIGLAARPAIERALETLSSHGLLAEGPAAPPEIREAAHAIAAGHGLSPTEAAKRLESATVGIVGSGARGVEVARLLRLAGAGEVRRVSWRRGAEVALTVVAPAADELDAVSGWNELALRRGLTWLPLRPFDGRMTGIGPIVVPGESCCYECVLLRRAANVEYGGDLSEIEAAPVAATADPPLDAAAAGLCAHLALRWLVAGDTTLAGVMFALEPRPTPALSEHFVLRVPRCPACSNARRFAPRLPWHEAQAA